MILCATAAFGQAAGVSVSSEPQPICIPSHQLHASQHSIQTGETLLFTANSETSARGERPLWEVAKLPAEVPLGDVARALRSEHAVARKAVKKLEK